MEEDCNAVYVMRGIGSLPLLFHLRFWPHSSRSRNVCRWVDRYLGRGFWQYEPKPPPLSLAIIPPRLEDRATLLLARTGGIHAEFHPDSSSAARRFRLISVNNQAGMDEWPARFHQQRISSLERACMVEASSCFGGGWIIWMEVSCTTTRLGDASSGKEFSFLVYPRSLVRDYDIVWYNIVVLQQK